MYAYSLDMNLGSSGIEVLVFQVAQVATVNGVSPVATKLLYIEVMGTHTDFLIRIEAHTDVAMLDFLMVAEVAHGLYDFSDTCLVVCTEQGCTVCNDDIFTLVSLEFGEFLNAADDAWTQFDILAVIVFDDASLNVLSAGVRTSIHV